jgi:hypothetical protein
MCNDFELTFEPDDGHIGLKHVVQQKETSEQWVCVKVTENNHQESGCYTTEFMCLSQSLGS